MAAVRDRRLVCRDCGRDFPGGGELCATCTKRRLADRVNGLVETLFPDGHHEGRQFRVGGLAGEPGRSLSVELAGERRGLWFDHAAGMGGDALDLIAAVHGNGEIGAALRWARDWLRLPAAVAGAGSARARPRAMPPPDRSPWQAPAVEQAVEEIWRTAEPLRRGDVVVRYLAGRGIDLERLAAAHDGRLPGSLRCHPRLWCREAGRHSVAMVGAIADPDGRLIGVHRTWLAESGDGSVGKARLEAPKRSLGHYRGGAVRLWHGASRLAWRLAPESDILALSEGIEDGLTAAQAQPAWRVAAAVSLSAMLSIVVPQQITNVVIIAQNDAPGSPAAQLLPRVRARFRAKGKRVWVLRPPGWRKDINDIVQSKRIANG